MLKITGDLNWPLRVVRRIGMFRNIVQRLGQDQLNRAKFFGAEGQRSQAGGHGFERPAHGQRRAGKADADVALHLADGLI